MSVASNSLSIMEPMYGRDGHVVSWVDLERARIYDLRGAVSGWVYGDEADDWRPIYSRGGDHRGWITESGLIRDHQGAVVSFLAGAVGGPPKPARHARPARPARQAAPARPARGARFARPSSVPAWSSFTISSMLQ